MLTLNIPEIVVKKYEEVQCLPLTDGICEQMLDIYAKGNNLLTKEMSEEKKAYAVMSVMISEIEEYNPETAKSLYAFLKDVNK
jgi:hypothetical protein